MERIKIKYHSDITPIVKKDKGDWIDLRSAETVSLKKGEFRLIDLGISMELPTGYEAIIAPRSSTYKNFKVIITNSPSVIDESYKGDNDIWKLPVLAMEDTTIEKDDRICQFRLLKHQPEIEFVQVESLGNENRGGIGSSGIK